MTHTVMPAKAGIHAESTSRDVGGESAWAPAFAGATVCDPADLEMLV
jgi:hypothetical protein